ncbi:MAG: aminopeptidase P family protein [Pseudomonadota bacterium]
MKEGKTVNSTIESRLSQFRKALSEKPYDTFLVLVGENRKYLSGFTGEDTGFDESAGVLLIAQEKAVLATDSRYDLQAKSEAPLFEVVQYKEGLSRELPGILQSLSSKAMGFESVRLTCLQFKAIEEQLRLAGLAIALVPDENLVENLRIRKEPAEITAIRKALAIAEDVFMAFVPSLTPGMLEKEVAWEMEKRLREAGAEALSFPTIVASGPNSALPHAIPGIRKIASGEPILFDWGVRMDGYCSDISRMAHIGKPDATYQKVYQTVLDAQRFATEAVKPGVSSKVVDAIARTHIENKGYKGKFGHGLGHGVGMAIHEAPRLSPLKDTQMEPGMVFTIEPGIYIAGWGGVRIENMAVVTETGVAVLNRTNPAEMIII